MAWASKALGTPANEAVAAVRTGITIESIATPRAMLEVRQKDFWPACKHDADLSDFDNVPLIEGNEIVGVYEREKDAVRGLSETMFTASDASLLSFVENADTRKFVFLVRENEIVGIVTLSDIQKLPVYCVLYSLLISVEMLLVELIRRACRAEPEKWLGYLDRESRRKIEDFWRKSRQENLTLDRLSCASFGNELTAAHGLGLISSDESATLRRLNGLRDLVSHGKEFALTLNRALEIPSQVRDALEIQVVLDQKLKGVKGGVKPLSRTS
jgi:hypothetical protein